MSIGSALAARVARTPPGPDNFPVQCRSAPYSSCCTTTARVLQGGSGSRISARCRASSRRRWTSCAAHRRRARRGPHRRGSARPRPGGRGPRAGQVDAGRARRGALNAMLPDDMWVAAAARDAAGLPRTLQRHLAGGTRYYVGTGRRGALALSAPQRVDVRAARSTARCSTRRPRHSWRAHVPGVRGARHGAGRRPPSAASCASAAGATGPAAGLRDRGEPVPASHGPFPRRHDDRRGERTAAAR